MHYIITMEECIVKCFQKSPIIHAVVLAVGICLSFITAYSGGYISLYVPFISETGAFSPSMCIFSLTLILGSFFGSLIFFYKYLINMYLMTEDSLLIKLNSISYIIGLASMLGLAGVAAFPMSTILWMHLVFAAMYFVGITVYFTLTSFMSIKYEGNNTKNTLRSVICILLLIMLFLLVIIFPVAQKKWKEENEFLPARKVPENSGFTLILISSLLEWAIALLIIAYILTFSSELNKHTIEFFAKKPTLDSTAPVCSKQDENA